MTEGLLNLTLVAVGAGIVLLGLLLARLPMPGERVEAVRRGKPSTYTVQPSPLGTAWRIR